MINEELLSSFPEGEMKKTLKEVIAAFECLLQKEPVYGFHHRFYVPGWICMIQLQCVKFKMNKFCKKNFYGGIGYRDFINWIADKANKVAKHADEIQTFDEETNDSCKKQVIEIFESLAEVWYQCCPEVAVFPNCYLNDKKISPYRFLQVWLAVILEDFGYPKLKEDSAGVTKDFAGVAKDFAWHFAGYIINILTLGVLAFLFS